MCRAFLFLCRIGNILTSNPGINAALIYTMDGLGNLLLLYCNTN